MDNDTLVAMESQDLMYHYYMICNVLLVTVSLLLNGCTILFVVGSSRLRKQHNIFTFNMALIDIISALTVIYILTPSLRNSAGVVVTTWGSFMISSSLNILLVAVYRFVTVHIDPFGVRNLVTTPRCIFACVVVWVLGSFPQIKNVVNLNFKWVSICVLVVFVLTGICYALLYRGVTRSRSVRRGVDGDEQRLKENRRLLKTFAAIYITSLSFWIPGFAYVFVASNNLLFQYISITAVHVNLVANPIIYWVRSNEFKAEVKRCIFKIRVVPVIV